MVEGGNAAIHRRRTGEADRDGDLAIVGELFAADHAVDGRNRGRDGVKDAVGRIKGALPDLTVDIEELVADGDQVVVRVLTRGTHAAPFRGIPQTGRSMTVGGIMIYRLADGLFVEDHEAVDELGLLRQLAPCPSALPASSPSVQTPPERAITRRGRTMKRLLISAVTASLLAGILAASVAASISAAEQATVFDGTNLSGSSTQFVYGTSNSNLNGIGWDNRISSLKTTTVIGHGFVFWTGPTYTDLQFKVCGPTTRNTMPSGFNNTISSYQSTTSCPQ